MSLPCESTALIPPAGQGARFPVWLGGGITFTLIGFKAVPGSVGELVGVYGNPTCVPGMGLAQVTGLLVTGSMDGCAGVMQPVIRLASIFLFSAIESKRLIRIQVGEEKSEASSPNRIPICVAVWLRFVEQKQGGYPSRMKYWEIIANNLSKAGWSWACVAALDSRGRTIWIAEAHRDDGEPFHHI